MDPERYSYIVHFLSQLLVHRNLPISVLLGKDVLYEKVENVPPLFHVLISHSSLFPNFAFCSSISENSILRKRTLIVPRSWPAGICNSDRDCHCWSCTVPDIPNWDQIFSLENGIKGSSMIAIDLTAFTAIYIVVGA